MKMLERFSEQAYALLRIVAGFMWTFHGLQKIFGLFSGSSVEMFSLMWFGGVIEIAGGILIMIGLFTRYAAFIASGQMAVAYFMFHWKFQFSEAFFPIVNKGELAVLYCFVFLYIATRGGVLWSVDKAKESSFSTN